MNTQVYKNTNRNKYKLNKEVMREYLIEYLNKTKTYNGFSIEKEFITENNFVKTKLLYLNNYSNYNYMDNNVREICTLLANDLRDILNKNFFFDLQYGTLIFYI